MTGRMTCAIHFIVCLLPRLCNLGRQQNGEGGKAAHVDEDDGAAREVGHDGGTSLHLGNVALRRCHVKARHHADLQRLPELLQFAGGVLDAALVQTQ